MGTPEHNQPDELQREPAGSPHDKKRRRQHRENQRRDRQENERLRIRAQSDEDVPHDHCQGQRNG
jgi:hypothetical protein